MCIEHAKKGAGMAIRKGPLGYAEGTKGTAFVGPTGPSKRPGGTRAGEDAKSYGLDEWENPPMAWRSELCTYTLMGKVCRFGWTCAQAHSRAQLRSREDPLPTGVIYRPRIGEPETPPSWVKAPYVLPTTTTTATATGDAAASSSNDNNNNFPSAGSLVTSASTSSTTSSGGGGGGGVERPGSSTSQPFSSSAPAQVPRHKWAARPAHEIEPQECPICADLFADSRILPCGHLICRDCLARWRSQSVGKNVKGTPCAECRTTVQSVEPLPQGERANVQLRASRGASGGAGGGAVGVWGNPDVIAAQAMQFADLNSASDEAARRREAMERQRLRQARVDEQDGHGGGLGQLGVDTEDFLTRLMMEQAGIHITSPLPSSENGDDERNRTQRSTTQPHFPALHPAQSGGGAPPPPGFGSASTSAPPNQPPANRYALPTSSHGLDRPAYNNVNPSQVDPFEAGGYQNHYQQPQQQNSANYLAPAPLPSYFSLPTPQPQPPVQHHPRQASPPPGLLSTSAPVPAPAPPPPPSHQHLQSNGYAPSSVTSSSAYLVQSTTTTTTTLPTPSYPDISAMDDQEERSRREQLKRTKDEAAKKAEAKRAAAPPPTPISRSLPSLEQREMLGLGLSESELAEQIAFQLRMEQEREDERLARAMGKGDESAFDDFHRRAQEDRDAAFARQLQEDEERARRTGPPSGSQANQSHAPPVPSGPRKWNCVVCTFENEPVATECAMCMMRR